MLDFEEEIQKIDQFFKAYQLNDMLCGAEEYLHVK